MKDQQAREWAISAQHDLSVLRKEYRDDVRDLRERNEKLLRKVVGLESLLWMTTHGESPQVLFPHNHRSREHRISGGTFGEDSFTVTHVLTMVLRHLGLKLRKESESLVSDEV